MSGLPRSKLQLQWSAEAVQSAPRLIRAAATTMIAKPSQQFELMQRASTYYVGSRRIFNSAGASRSADWLYEEADAFASQDRARALGRRTRVDPRAYPELTAPQAVSLLPYLSLASDSVFVEVSGRWAGARAGKMCQRIGNEPAL